MTFKSKRDRPFMRLITAAIILLALVTLGPIVFEIFYSKIPDMIAVWIMGILFLLCAVFILWTVFDIEYTFKKDYLFVRGGLFRSKILYEDITKVNPSSNILYGYRILSSKEGVEIHYKKSLMGSVIISPEKQELFLETLFERAPHIQKMK